jgi:hypothetical protein
MMKRKYLRKRIAIGNVKRKALAKSLREKQREWAASGKPSRIWWSAQVMSVALPPLRRPARKSG